jgi:predicted ATPase
MQLIERESLLTFLQTQLKNVSEGDGHCVCVSGEAGIGKTALVKAFCKQQQDNCNKYFGLCYALSTPHPLAPLYYIII